MNFSSKNAIYSHLLAGTDDNNCRAPAYNHIKNQPDD